jgi:TPR repeat protein
VHSKNPATTSRDSKALSTAAAAALKNAQDAEYRGDFTTAVSLFLPLANQGNAEAQVRLGLMYESGHAHLLDPPG